MKKERLSAVEEVEKFGNLRLIKPEQNCVESYYNACKESYNDTPHKYIIHNPGEYNQWKDTIILDYENSEKGINLPEGFVPSTTLWLCDGTEYLGTVNIRHRLTPALENFGGHVGVFLRTSARGKGLGRVISDLAVRETKKMLNDKPILITCLKRNTRAVESVRRYNIIKEETEVTEADGNVEEVVRFWL